MDERIVRKSLYREGKEKQREKSVAALNKWIDENIPYFKLDPEQSDMILFYIVQILKREQKRQGKTNVNIGVNAGMSERAVSEYFNLSTSIRDSRKMLKICSALGLNPVSVMMEALLWARDVDCRFLIENSERQFCLNYPIIQSMNGR